MTRFAIQFSIIIGLILIVAAPFVIADHFFGLSRLWATFIGLGSLITIMALGFSWLLVLQRRARRVLRTSRHEVFGEVRHLKDHWEASIVLTPHGPAVEVWGEAVDPSANETETFISIRQRLPQLLALIPDQIISMSPSSSLTLGVEDLCFDSVLLSSTTVGTFDLGFSLPKHERLFPWGVTVTFSSFKIDEVSDNH